mmetsp:Transcript_9550/g.28663  ORF Transcript_9550/g.28663 Transcript_9550/m.28663 type:complete len:222 (-) Transcript_9550:141-806(-)
MYTLDFPTLSTPSSSTFAPTISSFSSIRGQYRALSFLKRSPMTTSVRTGVATPLSSRKDDRALLAAEMTAPVFHNVLSRSNVTTRSSEREAEAGSTSKDSPNMAFLTASSRVLPPSWYKLSHLSTESSPPPPSSSRDGEANPSDEARRVVLRGDGRSFPRVPNGGCDANAAAALLPPAGDAAADRVAGSSASTVETTPMSAVGGRVTRDKEEVLGIIFAAS